MRLVPSSGGVELAVHDLGGPPDARPVLLCHATGFHGRVWRALATELPHRRCIALDFRGFGDSAAPADGRFDWYDFGADVLAVVDQLELADVQAVGHSKGGAALLIAEQERPGTFERLVLFEPIVFPPRGPDGPAGQTPGNSLADITRHRRETFDSFEDAIDRFGSKPPLAALRPDVLDDYVRFGFRPTDDGRVTLKAEREHEARTYEMGAEHGAFGRLGEVGCPVLVAHGGDRGGPAQFAPLVADQLPNGEVEAFPDLGHFGPLEDPVALGAVVSGYLDADTT